MSKFIKNNHKFNRDVTIPATSKLYLDGGGDTYLVESASNQAKLIVAGNDVIHSIGVTDTHVKAQRSIELTVGTGLVKVNSGPLSIDATLKLYFDGGGNTYIHEKSADLLQIVAGGDAIVNFQESGSSGNLVDFTTTAAGFTQHEPTYGATNTDVEFRTLGNKGFFTFGAGSVTNARLYFPGVSCSCTLVVRQDGTGSRTITNWKAYDSAGNAAAGSSSVLWAGGSAPTLSTGANAIDIISFYWDKDNEVAYGVASLNFS